MSNRRALLVLYLVAFLQNLAMTSAGGIIPVYLRVMGATELIVGISFAWFSFVRGSTSLVSGQLTDRVGRRTLLVASLAGFAFSNLAYALAGHPLLIVAFRLLQGLAAGLYWVVILTMVADLSPLGERLRNLTWFNIAMAFSGMGANWLGGYLAETHSPRLVFSLSFLIFCVASVLALRMLPVDSALTAGKKRNRGLKSLLSVSARVKLISLLAGIGMIAETVNTMGMSMFVYGAGGRYGDVGLIAGLIVASGLLMQLLAPTIKQKLGYKGIIISVYAINAGLLSTLYVIRSLAAAYVLFPIIGGLFTLTSLAWLTLAQSNAHSGQTGTATGFFRGVLDLTSVGYYLGFGVLSSRFGVPPLIGAAALVLVLLAVSTLRIELEAAPQSTPRTASPSAATGD